jgi:hypothetical protein
MKKKDKRKGAFVLIVLILAIVGMVVLFISDDKKATPVKESRHK